MKKAATLLFLSVWFLPVFGQIHCTSQNQQLLQRQILHHNNQDYTQAAIGDIAIAVGKNLIGTPYVGKTLEINDSEPLVINLAGLDCTTFLENVVVFSRLLTAGNLSEESFYQELEQLRYRDGNRDGYLSRLHYFSDWMVNNEAKDIIQPISRQLGGIPWQREINFMTSHADLYPFLEGEEMISALSEVEQQLSEKTFYYIPEEQLPDLESGIQNGDLIAITTTVNGLDIAHVGLAIWVNDRVHMFHASSSLEKVVISEEPLADYLAGNRSQSGVMVSRLITPGRE